MMRPTLRCPCDLNYCQTVFHYDAPPPGEMCFDVGAQAYQRAYLRCALCRHWYSENPLDLSRLYESAYVSATYGDSFRETFQRILALPIERSDNAARVARVLQFARAYLTPGKVPTLLDIGSGLGVFPYRMKEAGWDCTVLDPDARAVEHAATVVCVRAIRGDFLMINPEQVGTFDLITFNKVLEHVVDPVGMLQRATGFLRPNGRVYIELPDGEVASHHGSQREEFFIEHHHVFSAGSLNMLAERAGFLTLSVERLHEPSGKFTLCAFLALKSILPAAL
ncbi:MAG: class I SAM-dependent methyltransferase [Nitrospira sp.]|nr:class I SAM-dependent methyltransferase [Nitrospira sp.]